MRPRRDEALALARVKSAGAGTIRKLPRGVAGFPRKFSFAAATITGSG